jgi:YD repeat-containing protein
MPNAVDPYTTASVLHYDDRGRVVQVDGFAYDGYSKVRMSAAMAYDEQDRLVRAETELGDRVITYFPNEALATLDGSSYRYELDGAGRVLRYHGPLALPEADQYSYVFEYDAAGNLTRELGKDFDAHYTYDDRGRLLSGEGHEITYTETGNGLSIVDQAPFGSTRSWKIAFDDAQRIVHLDEMSDSQLDATVDYVYGQDVSEERSTLDGFPSLITAAGGSLRNTVELAPRSFTITWRMPYVSQQLPRSLFEYH